MELLIYTVFTSIWWLLSMSVFLPFIILLRISKSFRDMWFPFHFTYIVGPIVGDKGTHYREQAFKVLQEHLKNRNTKMPLDALEIGIGGGANLEYYPENTRLTGLDINDRCMKDYEKSKKKYQQISYQKFIIAGAENMNEIGDATMDLVVGTYVLCTAKGVNRVLSEVLRVLKPGGVFLSIEHATFPRSDWRYMLQRYAAPLWNIYFDGCDLNLDVVHKINTAGFSQVKMKSLEGDLPLFIRKIVVGIAEK